MLLLGVQKAVIGLYQVLNRAWDLRLVAVASPKPFGFRRGVMVQDCSLNKSCFRLNSSFDERCMSGLFCCTVPCLRLIVKFITPPVSD